MQNPLLCHRTSIEELAGSLKFPLTKLFVVDGSTRSAHSNAYMYGFFRNKRIVLYDTLIEQCKEGEVVAVLAHELGHWKLGHTLKNLALTQLQMLSTFALFSVVRSSAGLFTSFGFVDRRPAFIAYTLFSIISAPVGEVRCAALHRHSTPLVHAGAVVWPAAALLYTSGMA
jgi:STE24 endopeptidase